MPEASLAESYEFCRRLARTRAKNFYYSFILLSMPQRDAMCAIYTFMRRCDDLTDEPGIPAEEARQALAGWREELSIVLDGGKAPYPGWPAFIDSVRRYQIPHRYFYEMIEGVESDLDRPRIETYSDLYRYCYLVASVVGLTVLHVFGYESAQAPALAEKCGVAFQLTNILRDIREDAESGRTYLPAEDLKRFGVSPEVLRSGKITPPLRNLMEFEAERAASLYREAAPLVGMVPSQSRASLRALITIYWQLLMRIEQSGFDVLSRRQSLRPHEKAAIVARSALGIDDLKALAAKSV